MNKRARGYSLIELMVAVTLGLVILAGVIRVFIGSKQGYQVEQSSSRAQENARFAVEFLNRQIMLADLWDGVKPANVNVLGTVTYPGIGNCSGTWVIDPQNGIRGYAGTTTVDTSAAPGSCAGANYVPYSDILAVRHIDPENYSTTANLGTATTGKLATGGFWVRSLMGSRAEVFDKSSVGSLSISGDYDVGVLNYPFQAALFYLENADNGAGAVPTLTMAITQGTSFVKQPLIDGVEMLRIQYGLDTNADASVDQYVDAGSVSDWTQVISVRLAMIVRGDTLDNFSDTQNYQMTKTFCYGPAGSTCASSTNGAPYTTGPGVTNSQVAKYQRRLIIKEIQLRNRIRG